MYRRTASNADKKDEVPDFMERIPPELSLEVYVAPLYSFNRILTPTVKQTHGRRFSSDVDLAKYRAG